MNQYYRFVDLDPYKGETHYYYIPTTSAAVQPLLDFCKTSGTFDLSVDRRFEEDEVHDLVFENMNKFHHKVSRVNLPRSRPPESSDLRDGKAFTVQYTFFKEDGVWKERVEPKAVL